MAKRKYPKLRGKTLKMASKFISEEVKTRKYSRKQAVAIGISRARAATGKSSRENRIAGIMKRYR